MEYTVKELIEDTTNRMHTIDELEEKLIATEGSLSQAQSDLNNQAAAEGILYLNIYILYYININSYN
jgi:hypothetical protein